MGDLRARIERDVPQDEVVQRYEAGDSIRSVIAYLRELGLPANQKWIDLILDDHQVIRHADSGCIPKGAPQGFSVASTAALSRAAIFDKYGDQIQRSIRPWAEEVRRMRMHKRMTKPLKRERRMAKPKLPRRAEEQKHSPRQGAPKGVRPNLHVTEVGKPRFSGDGPLSGQNLKRLAERHGEGKGGSAKTLARDAGVSEAALRRALIDAGYVVSNRAQWTKRELEKLVDDIVYMYRDEEKTFEFILGFLRAQDVHISLERLRALLRNEGIPFRITSRSGKKKPRRAERSRTRRMRSTGKISLRERRNQGRLDPSRRIRPTTSGSHWDAIAGREEELARRILEGGEPVRKLAEELGVAHNWLAMALKRTGYLPDVNLSRLRKQIRLKRQGENESAN